MRVFEAAKAGVLAEDFHGLEERWGGGRACYGDAEGHEELVRLEAELVAKLPSNLLQRGRGPVGGGAEGGGAGLKRGYGALARHLLRNKQLRVIVELVGEEEPRPLITDSVTTDSVTGTNGASLSR